MSILLTTKPDPGKSIVGYKVYRNITGVSAGISAGITGYSGLDIVDSLNNRDKLFVNLYAPANNSGILDKLYLGLYIDTNVDTDYYPFDIRVYNIDEDASGKYIEQVSSTSSGVFITSPATSKDIVYEIDISPSISITAGQVIGLFFDWTDITDEGAGIHLHSMNNGSFSAYVNSSTTTIDSKIYYSEFTNSEDIDDYKQGYSFELINDFSTSWQETTSGYTRYTTVATDVISGDTNGTSVTTDLGSITQLNMIQLDNDEDKRWEIQIRDNASDPWISVYYGRPEAYGTVQGHDRYIGFPYKTRYVKFIRRDTGTHTTINLYMYGPITAHDGNKFVASGNTIDYLLVDPEEYDTSSYWYSVAPVDVNLNRGQLSVPVSNRINIV